MITQIVLSLVTRCFLFSYLQLVFDAPSHFAVHALDVVQAHFHPQPSGATTVPAAATTVPAAATAATAASASVLLRPGAAPPIVAGDASVAVVGSRGRRAVYRRENAMVRVVRLRQDGQKKSDETVSRPALTRCDSHRRTGTER